MGLLLLSSGCDVDLVVDVVVDGLDVGDRLDVATVGVGVVALSASSHRTIRLARLHPIGEHKPLGIIG